MGFPAVKGRAVRVAEQLFQIGAHRTQRLGRKRRGRLIIEINGAALAAHAALIPARSRSARHAARKPSISAAVVDGASDARITSFAASAATPIARRRSEEHTSELQTLMRLSYAVFCLKKTTTHFQPHIN